MAFPEGWPPRAASGRRSIRFFKTGTATAAFADSAYLFSVAAGSNPYTAMPYVSPGNIGVVNLGDGLYSSGVSNSPNPANEPVPMIWSASLRITNDGGGELEYSFDGENVHGLVHPGETIMYASRNEAGISFRGAGAVFRVEAW